jgi:hypothetical protein
MTISLRGNAVLLVLPLLGHSQVMILTVVDRRFPLGLLEETVVVTVTDIPHRAVTTMFPHHHLVVSLGNNHLHLVLHRVTDMVVILATIKPVFMHKLHHLLLQDFLHGFRVIHHLPQ